MVHDLEQVLAIEAARTGEATGEATTILRSLPGDTGDFAPERLRHPRRALFARIAVLALVRRRDRLRGHAHREGRGPGGHASPGAGLSEVQLGASAATDYDPEGDGEESPSARSYAIDGHRTTDWDTETYEGGVGPNDKTGVGLYVDAGTPLAARQLDVVTSTPGFEAAVYALQRRARHDRRLDQGERHRDGRENQRFQLDTARRRFRYYLVWITELPRGRQGHAPGADAQEVTLSSR